MRTPTTAGTTTGTGATAEKMTTVGGATAGMSGATLATMTAGTRTMTWSLATMTAGTADRDHVHDAAGCD